MNTIVKRRSFLRAIPLSVAGFLPSLKTPQSPTRLIVIEGNSLSSMGNGVISWPQKLAQTAWMRGLNFGVVNVAIGGATIVDLFERAPLVDSLTGIADECYLLVFELTNTMQKFNGDVAGVYQRHREYCEARRAAGFRVLVGTMLSRDDEPTYHTPRNFSYAQADDLNGTIRRTYREFADGLVDFAAVPELGDENACTDPRYFWDGIHLTAEGSSLVLAALLSNLQSRIYQYYAPITINQK